MYKNSVYIYTHLKEVKYHQNTKRYKIFPIKCLDKNHLKLTLCQTVVKARKTQKRFYEEK